MPVLDHQPLRDLTADIFQAVGAPGDQARTVADMLIDADLMGLPSHGLQRVIQYVHDARQGAIKPGAEIIIDRRSPTTALVDGQWNFGQVVASRATQQAIAMAHENGMGSVVVRGCRHVGRLGAFTELCAADHCIGMAAASSGNEGYWVAPFGGREGRLGTNPISIAVPAAADPLVMDFSTSALPEGKVRLIRDSGQRLPQPLIVNADGKPSDDPWDLYNKDTGERAGAILPFGGDQGYKSFGFAFMAQILAACLGDPLWSHTDIRRNTNGMWLLAMRVEAFMDADAFRADVQAMTAYIKSTKPAGGSRGVMSPGQRELDTTQQRRRDGIPVHEDIWDKITNIAAELNVDAPAPRKD
ncbi:MAG: hypothetical protein CMJ49_07320 [Planctomycetaceae bacterium]|nr:hypothetical protein [Planctomycetaceae bacterium]